MATVTYALGPVDRATVQSNVLNAIRNAIIYGELQPGTKLVETALAEQLGTSRGPVREALRQLHEEGLVTHVPYRGHFVAHITPAEVRELFSLRIVLETFAVRLATERLTHEALERLQSLILEMDQAAVRADLPELVESDLEFHKTICELSGHSLLLSVWDSLVPHVRRFIAVKGLGAMDKLSMIARSHEPILQALEARNSKGAERAISEHLRHMAEIVLGQTFAE